MDNKDFMVVDKQTGEILDNAHFAYIEAGDRIYRKAQLDHARIKYERYNDSTDFIWMAFQYGKSSTLGISRPNFTRLALAALLCRDDGLLGRKETVRDCLELNKNQWSDFWNEATSKRVLIERDGAVYIDTAVFSKGEIHTNKDFIRLFTGFYGELYNTAKTQSEHTHISYILQMIPFLNRQTNILSHNPKEQDNAAVVPMTLYDYCEKIGYDKSHAARLRKQLSKFIVDGEPVVGFFDKQLELTELSARGVYIVVNPKLCFGGDRNTDGYKQIRGLFEAKKTLASDPSAPC